MYEFMLMQHNSHSYKVYKFKDLYSLCQNRRTAGQNRQILKMSNQFFQSLSPDKFLIVN